MNRISKESNLWSVLVYKYTPIFVYSNANCMYKFIYLFTDSRNNMCTKYVFTINKKYYRMEIYMLKDDARDQK